MGGVGATMELEDWRRQAVALGRSASILEDCEKHSFLLLKEPSNLPALP
jgi:hypothetical protein